MLASSFQLRNHLSFHPDPKCAAVWPLTAAAPTLPQLWLRHWEDKGIPVYQRTWVCLRSEGAPGENTLGSQQCSRFLVSCVVFLQEGRLHDEGIMHKWGSPVCSSYDSVCLLLCGGFVPQAAWEGSWVATFIPLRDERSVSNCGNTPYPCQVGSV